ncbi:MAG: hypothetical protein ABI600_09680 [Luteolibacter sp.]
MVASTRLAALDTPAADSSTDKPTLFFEVIYWGSWMDRPLKYKSGTKLKAIPLQNGSPTCYLYSGSSPLVLYRDEVEDPKTKELTPVPILSLPFQISWRRAALIITPDKDNKLTAQMIPLIADVFPPDSVYMVNASGKALKCRLADQTWDMTINQKKLFPMAIHESKIYLLAASEWNGAWQVMYSDSFRPVEGERRVIYFHTPNGTEGVSAMASVIPPDNARFDGSGHPIESAAVDPNFKPSTNPRGTAEWEPGK